MVVVGLKEVNVYKALSIDSVSEHPVLGKVIGSDVGHSTLSLPYYNACCLATLSSLPLKKSAGALQEEVKQASVVCLNRVCLAP